MEHDKSWILVTWDFTDKSTFALEHAIQASSVAKCEICLLHIVKTKREIANAEKRMTDVIRTKYPDSASNIKVIAREGSIFHTISEISDEKNALLIFMGTHGIQGMQKFLGSWALKVIASTKTPFVVVQEPPKSISFGTVVIPVNYRKEIKECVMWAHFFAKRFETKFILFRAAYSDKNLHRNVDSNILFITKYFNGKGIRFEVHESSGKHDFGNEAVSYATQIESDAVMLMTTRDIGFGDYVLRPQEQYMIANSEKLPVICINPRPAKLGGGFSASGG